MPAPTSESSPCGPPQITSELRELFLSQLDRRSENWGGSERREHVRHPYRVPAGVMVAFTGEDGSCRCCFVNPRNISAGGIAFLDEHFVAPGAGCAVMLETTDGGIIEACGRVVACRHVHERLHEVAVCFDETLAVGDVVTDEGGGGEAT